MADKKLDALLSEGTTKPMIRRGQGIRLSTDSPQDEPTIEPEESAHVHNRTNAQVQKSAPGQVQRISQGQRLRADLIKAMKRVALEEDRKFYEVMEEAMEQYLDRRKQGTT